MTAGSARFDADKIWYFKAPPLNPVPMIKVGIVGAGDLHFLVDTKETIRRRLEADCADRNAEGKPSISLDEAENIVREVILETHHHHIYPIGTPYERQDNNIDLIVGLRTEDGQRLISTSLTAVTPIERAHHIGVGPDLARFLIGRFGDGPLTTSDAVFLSAQILVYAEKQLSNVGGRRRIMVIYPFERSSGFVEEKTIRESERFVERMDAALQPVLFGATYTDVSDVEFVNRLETFKGEMMDVRKIRREIRLHLGSGIHATGLHPSLLATSGATEPPLAGPHSVKPSGELTLKKLQGNQGPETDGS